MQPRSVSAPNQEAKPRGFPQPHWAGSAPPGCLQGLDFPLLMQPWRCFTSAPRILSPRFARSAPQTNSGRTRTRRSTSLSSQRHDGHLHDSLQLPSRCMRGMDDSIAEPIEINHSSSSSLHPLLSSPPCGLMAWLVSRGVFLLELQYIISDPDPRGRVPPLGSRPAPFRPDCYNDIYTL